MAVLKRERKYRVSKNVLYRVSEKYQNIKSIMSLIIILVIECLIYALPTVKISSTYLYPLRCDMVSLKIDK